MAAEVNDDPSCVALVQIDPEDPTRGVICSTRGSNNALFTVRFGIID